MQIYRSKFFWNTKQPIPMKEAYTVMKPVFVLLV